MVAETNQNPFGLIDLWNAFKQKSSDTSEEDPHKLIIAKIHARVAIPQLSNLLMLPLQPAKYSLDAGNELLTKLVEKGTTNGWKLQVVKLFNGFDPVLGVCCFPPGFDIAKQERCILYHNPNTVSLLDYFENGVFQHTPATLAAEKNVPIYLYDYRSCGVSQLRDTDASFTPSYESLISDGSIFLDHALQHYKHVEVWGSSLGAYIATESTNSFLEKHQKYADRLSLYSHDGFATTSLVHRPTWTRTANFWGWMFGGHINAVTPIKNLLEKGVQVTILQHTLDPLIPENACLHEHAVPLTDNHKLSIISSAEYGHANFTEGMLNYIKEISPSSTKSNTSSESKLP